MIIVLPLPILISAIVVGVVCIIVGLVRANGNLMGWGEIILGLGIFALPMVNYLHEASDTSGFSPSSGEIALLGIMAFLGGMSTALGLRTLLVREAKPSPSS